jgi:hypothetical protein
MRSGTGDAETTDRHDAEFVETGAHGADLVSVLAAIDVPIVVVGRDCTLVRFYRSAKHAHGIDPSDIGPLPRDLAAQADVKDCQKV